MVSTMAELEQSATQRPSSKRSHTPDDNRHSLPTPTASSQESTGRPKQLPTITPRRFTRFFTPRSSLKRQVKIGASRQVLREITAGDSNRRSLGRRRSLSKDTVQILEDQIENFENVSRKRKRGIPLSPDTTPDNSSPLKRTRGAIPPIQGGHESDVETDDHSETSDTRPLQEEANWDDELGAVKRIVRWKKDSLLGHKLRRECDGDIGNTRGRIHAMCGPGE